MPHAVWRGFVNEFKENCYCWKKNSLFKHHLKLLPLRDHCCMVFKKKILNVF